MRIKMHLPSLMEKWIPAVPKKKRNNQWAGSHPRIFLANYAQGSEEKNLLIYDSGGKLRNKYRWDVTLTFHSRNGPRWK